MSYSFDFTVATKEEAKTRAASELDGVLTYQPVHAKDRDAALATATAFIDLLADDDTKDIRVSVAGSVSWPYDVNDPNGQNNPPLSNASVSVGAWHVPKAAAEQPTA